VSGAVRENVPTGARLTSIDALRGVVMIIMALDHTRDFFHVGAMSFQPDDLARTTPALFFTRWVTHICAPTFVFLAGLGAFWRLDRGGRPSELSRFLLTRGVWLILLETTVMRLAMNFTFDLRYPVLLLILWALGCSMVALSALIHLPRRLLLALSLTVLLLHNALDGIRPAQFGDLAGVWTALHQPGVVILRGIVFVIGYPILPWIALMAVGFCAGPLLHLSPGRRRRIVFVTGAAVVVAFFIIRGINLYGDPSPWSQQADAMTTMLSFLRTTKYPPSLIFLLMALGPSLLLLGYFDVRRLRDDHPLLVVGRVPLFYYVLHFCMLHVLSSTMTWWQYGNASLRYLMVPLPSMGGPRELFPEGFGYPLWVVYVVWIGLVLAIYPLCRWFDGYKRRHRSWWLGYV
jgi:uncharacterized membrane protein